MREGTFLFYSYTLFSAQKTNERMERESDKRSEDIINVLGIVFGILVIIEPLSLFISNIKGGVTDRIHGLLWFGMSFILLLIVGLVIYNKLKNKNKR